MLNKDHYWHVRRIAGEALGKLGDPRAIESLEQQICNSNEYDVKIAFKEAIAKIKSAATKPGQSATSTAPAE
ncbi:MAG: HEAT repeat domain-containing protein [Planctomycetes bacterium]|nr:HEAT repeat domain-containing protein [Planctomycetota bacterium]